MRGTISRPSSSIIKIGALVFFGLLAMERGLASAFMAVRGSTRSLFPCCRARVTYGRASLVDALANIHKQNAFVGHGALETQHRLYYSLCLDIPTPEDMEDLGAVLSMGTGPGDSILLKGDLGAGKTCLARGFVRARTGMADISVTSPTYLLSNTYEADDGALLIHHMDLYRLSGDKDLEPLNMNYVLSNCLSLIEWPSRLGSLTPTVRLDATFKIEDLNPNDDFESKRRYLTLDAHGGIWEERLKLLVSEGFIDDFIIANNEAPL
uniref:tRNA threonylcarbamoyladenosine biosynthesis protein TsaE n=1 Tax=Attheya septentrionalis TaxID=420275 RepID=A0A7S2XNM5_9STRA|mmetsp:Transcript_24769/g.44860  ORF Transcript_24769/g.44860 Transcript_24769/m.44860 type:complete len:266 (+) Transcript_24769:88-885(+)